MTAINLLIVEDSADDAELMVRALRRAGVDPAYERVETAPAMEEALARNPGTWSSRTTRCRISAGSPR